jgi:ribonuclease BN (tRNA processing enzyme)
VSRRRIACAPLLAAMGCAPTPPAASTPAPTRASHAEVAGGRCRPGKGTPSVFELVVLGSGGPRGFGRAASSYLVVVDGVARVLVDVGPGAFVRLGEMGVDFKALDTVLLTHLHIDHAGDLAGFVKSRDLTYDEPLTFRVFGPAGEGVYPSTTAFVDRLFGKSGAFAYLPGFRNELGLSVVDLPASPLAPVQEVLKNGDLRVTSIAVDHDDVPAVAYRIEHAGHALVVSGDLASKNDNLTRLAANADLLVYDTAVVDPPGSPSKLYDLHTAPRRIGEVAAAAHVRRLVLSHIPPSVEANKDAVLRSVAAGYRGPTLFAEDCLRIDVAK